MSDNKNEIKNEISYGDDKILSLARYLGQIIKADERLTALEKAKEEYLSDKRVNELLAEYRTSQAAILTLYGKEEESETHEKINARMNEIYDEIANSDAYKKYENAQNTVNELMAKVNSAISEEVSGKSECTHDCSTCKGCH